jgi:hypothetical protein
MTFLSVSCHENGVEEGESGMWLTLNLCPYLIASI